MRETLIRVINENAENYANQITCQTLILWGANDQVTPTWQAKRLTQLIPNSGLFVWPNAGHFSHLDEPYRTAKAIDLFINPNNQN